MFNGRFIKVEKEENTWLERVPAKVYILKTFYYKVVRKSDTGKYHKERQILIHPFTPVLVNKCMASTSVLMGIIIGKFMYHLPCCKLQLNTRSPVSPIVKTTNARKIILMWPFYFLRHRFRSHETEAFTVFVISPRAVKRVKNTIHPWKLKSKGHIPLAPNS